MTIEAGAIRHMALFSLHHQSGSAEEMSFFEALASLAAIPGVDSFQVLSQVSPKNPYRHAVSMEFSSQSEYDAYNEHPDHVRFVEERWLPEVADFTEVDCTPTD